MDSRHSSPWPPNPAGVAVCVVDEALTLVGVGAAGDLASSDPQADLGRGLVDVLGVDHAAARQLHGALSQALAGSQPGPVHAAVPKCSGGERRVSMTVHRLTSRDLGGMAAVVICNWPEGEATAMEPYSPERASRDGAPDLSRAAATSPGLDTGDAPPSLTTPEADAADRSVGVPVRLSEPLSVAASLAATCLCDAGVSVRTSPGREGGTIIGNGAELVGAFFRLFVAAGQGLPPGGVVTAEVTGGGGLRGGPSVGVCITGAVRGLASGLGSYPSAPFLMLDRPVKQARPPQMDTGTYLSYRVIAAHGGRLQTHALPEGGTSFHAFFPTRRGCLCAPHTLPSRRHSAAAGTPTVLVLEPDADLREVLVEALSDTAGRVLVAQGAEEAAGLLREGRADLAVIALPGARPLRGSLQETVLATACTLPWTPPIIALTDRDEPDLEERLSALGVTAYLAKPFTLAQFVEMVAALLEP